MNRLQQISKASVSQRPFPLLGQWDDHENWLVGFFEGDGSFSIRRRGDLGIIITQKERAILFQIQKRFNFGRIHIQGSAYRWAAQSQADMAKMIAILNGKLKTSLRQKQFKGFLDAFNQKYNTAHMYKGPASHHLLHTGWLAGLIDAEGCFSISFLKKPYAVRVRFLLGQKNEKGLLTEVMAAFGCGAIESKKGGFDVFVISGIQNVFALFGYLENFPLQSNKKLSYRKWRYVHFKLCQKVHLKSKQKRARLIELAKQINLPEREGIKLYKK